MPPKELTLIVAATSKMGIGRNGTLPWTGLKKEMAYFARVTKRADADKPNAVIMGRKTWQSIPPRFRPLKDRLNAVITRTPSELGISPPTITIPDLESSVSAEQTKDCSKIFIIGGAQIYKLALEQEKSEKAETTRILLTRILSDFECDTFFPLELKEDGTAEGWERKSKQELDDWVGEKVPEGVQEENGTKYVFEMWEKKR